MDTNNDGLINSSDTGFNSLKLWQDMDEDGVLNSGEMKTLSEASITALKVTDADLFTQGNGNYLSETTSNFTMDFNYWRGQISPVGGNDYILIWNSRIYTYPLNQPLIASNGAVAVGTSGNDNFDYNYFNTYPYNQKFNINNIQSFLAGAGDDVMGGNNANNNLFGGTGNDSFYGGAGNDSLPRSLVA